MKLNNRGFTLIELLAVIVLLLLISTMAVTSITAAIERNNKKQDAIKIELIESYAKLYYDQNKNSFGDISSVCIELDELNLSDKEEIDSSGQRFEGVIKYDNGFKFKKEENC